MYIETEQIFDRAPETARVLLVPCDVPIAYCDAPLQVRRPPTALLALPTIVLSPQATFSLSRLITACTASRPRRIRSLPTTSPCLRIFGKSCPVLSLMQPLSVQSRRR